VRSPYGANRLEKQPIRVTALRGQVERIRQRQLNPFPKATENGAVADPIIGLSVHLPDRCRCGSDVVLIASGSAVHRAALECRACGQHRGRLSKQTAGWLEKLVIKFGPPTNITLRRLLATSARFTHSSRSSQARTKPRILRG
jgi:hypothetical protein